MGFPHLLRPPILLLVVSLFIYLVGQFEHCHDLPRALLAHMQLSPPGDAKPRSEGGDARDRGLTILLLLLPQQLARSGGEKPAGV